MRVMMNGHALEVHESGVGAPALVLLHGFPLSSRMYEPVRPVLENATRVAAVDLRGFGESDAPEGSYGMDELAGDVLVGCLEGMRDRPDSRELLPTLDVPALVIVGADEECAFADVGAALPRR